MPETAGRGKQLDHGRNAMSRKRLSISIAAAALLAVGAVACSDGGTKTVTVGGGSTTPSGASDTTGGSSSGEKVKIIASVPPTDHGWLGAISKNAQAAADQSA